MFADEFPHDPGVVYLNHAAVAPWPRRAVEAVQAFAEENLKFGAQHYEQWLHVEQELREQLRWLVNAESKDEIALLKNTSEGLSVIAHGLLWRPGYNVVTSDQEFPSNRVVWESLASRDVQLREADLNAGDSPEANLIALIDDNTRLLTVSSVQFGSGLRLDLERLGAACRERNVLFCVDAIQSLGALPFDAQACHADFVVADGHKWMLGPEGLALFYCRAGIRDRLALHQYGWHMVQDHGNFDRRDWEVAAGARRFECGSPNMLGVHGLHASLSLIQEIGLETIERNILKNASYLIDYIDSNTGLQLISPHTPQQRSGIVTFRSTQTATDVLFNRLREAGVVCAMRGGGIRFSPHFYTSTQDLDRALAHIW